MMTRDLEITTKPFNVGHLDWFKTTPELRPKCYEMSEWLTALGKLGQCATHMIDGRLLYISAIYTVAPGVMEVFLLPSVYVKDYAISFYRHVKSWLVCMAGQEGTRRVQTWGEDTKQSIDWLASLGFKLEGVLHSYKSDGRAMLIWGMTWQTQ